MNNPVYVFVLGLTFGYVLGIANHIPLVQVLPV